ncbi:hypothetical protein VII00023_15166 [Vibrio ichthyoenteri ATCC 700023]|uniref:Plasmid partition ParA protein n=1 Tax=Vibrio ichthyoenteri ATCC 700023 TaxID=870968 RepID=F9S6W6_9VIBR|nr:DUF1365 family protein [Vibrio ichthyoenteri]EGU32247.1 hypothetical protein VII00023_15166 [Vibrio ichthyoenteri ATCC 700023]
MNSSLLVGMVRHKRSVPVVHELNYPLFMPCLDLDELDQVFTQVWGMGAGWWHWARFRRQDYLGQGSLKQAVLDKVEQLTGERLKGKVEAVIHLRYLGIYFSPVNFYYVYDCHGEWRYLLAEVSNTPWNERHYYAIPATESGQFEHEKSFHVSPFNPIEQLYQWRIKPLNKTLNIHLECHRKEKEFEATMAMKKTSLDSSSLIRHLIATPIMAVKVVIGIYWHAFKLWCKGAPLYTHPNADSLEKSADCDHNKSSQPAKRTTRSTNRNDKQGA